MEEIELVSRRKSASSSTASKSSRRSGRRSNANNITADEDTEDEQPEPIVGRSLNSSNGGGVRNRFSDALISKKEVEALKASPRKSIRTYKVSGFIGTR